VNSPQLPPLEFQHRAARVLLAVGLTGLINLILTSISLISATIFDFFVVDSGLVAD
jgi:uncharacterized membrane protein YqaE (UPF0057 family)